MAMGDAVETAVRSLRRGDRSRREIDERLERAGFDEAARRGALERLERAGYVHDARYAAARAATLAGRGYGDGAIRADLLRRGIEAEALAAAIAGLAEEAERARAVVRRLGRTPRAAAQLTRKGFGEHAVEAALGPEIAENVP